jgi:hypothetical protein
MREGEEEEEEEETKHTSSTVRITYWCDQCDGFDSARVPRSEGEGDDAAHGVADQVERCQVHRLHDAPLDRVDVVSQRVVAARRLRAPPEPEEVHRQQPAVGGQQFFLPEHRLGPEGRRRREPVDEDGVLGFRTKWTRG